MSSNDHKLEIDATAGGGLLGSPTGSSIWSDKLRESDDSHQESPHPSIFLDKDSAPLSGRLFRRNIIVCRGASLTLSSELQLVRCRVLVEAGGCFEGFDVASRENRLLVHNGAVVTLLSPGISNYVFFEEPTPMMGSDDIPLLFSSKRISRAYYEYKFPMHSPSSTAGAAPDTPNNATGALSASLDGSYSSDTAIDDSQPQDLSAASSSLDCAENSGKFRVMSGWIYKKPRSGWGFWRYRWLEIRAMDGLLEYYTDEKKTSLRGSIELHQSLEVLHEGPALILRSTGQQEEEVVFEFIPMHRRRQRSSTAREASEWVKVIREAINNLR